MITNHADPDWWRQACVYQIYPRSFADANGDGIGDLKGITSRIPYLVELGVDAVWLSPFYPSPLKDGGYDVSDYRDVDPRIGTLSDFEEMTSKLKDSGIKVIVDIVPNHSSDEHEWFQAALAAGKDSKERARFHFQDGLGPDKSSPPSDWQGAFGGPCWTKSGMDDGQWYFHMFDKSQPDFNWENPDVRQDFLETLRFWGNKGVAGFRIDVAAACTKDLGKDMLLLPWDEVLGRRMRKSKHGNRGEDIDHPFFDRDETLEIYKEWREVFNEFDPPLCAVAEAYVAPDRKKHYASPDGLGQVFSFDIMLANFDVGEYRTVIDRQMQSLEGSESSTTWVLSNHDVVRHHTRFGLPKIEAYNLLAFKKAYAKYLAGDGKDSVADKAAGLRRGRAATLMILALPGSTYLYQGEELGLPEVADIPEDQLQDPTFFLCGKSNKGRDGCRVPLPWTREGKNFGNGDGSPAHLPQPKWYAEYAVDVQDKDPHSTLGMYRTAMKLRRELQSEETMQWKVDLGLGDQVLAFQRPGGWLTVLNGGEVPVELPKGEVLVASGEINGGKIPPETTVWLRVNQE